jgi:hypothetical protein
MADRIGLGFVGFVFGGVTAMVMLIAVVVVSGHVQGRFALDDPGSLVEVSAARLTR